MQSTRAIQVVGCHAEGEIGDVIVGGILPPPGDSVFAQMKAFERDFDHLRRFLLCEPRGSVARHINLLVPPKRSDCVAGAIIMEPTEYPPMSGSNTMCITTVLLETGLVPMREPVTTLRLDMPGGPVDVTARCVGGKVRSVTIANVPSFALHLDAVVEVEGVGSVAVDIAYGGMIYALVDATRLGFEVVPAEARDLAVLGEKIRLAARSQLTAVHPENPDISGVSIVQLNTPFSGAGSAARNTCIVAPGRSDRSPTGTGLSARLAVLHARGLLKVGDRFAHTSLIGSRFEGEILSETLCGGRPAIVPAITGRAWITGTHTYLLDPTDPWPDGYVLGDTWGTTGETRQT
ncbi:proline racemase family protein [Mongoliimonas terrestris]|uniref:proline racemase family protein n=1 Tax=Mongoliimonas terrestris TaxID=1709001 RepID=UPI000949912A|nr:proline racemase family protein [Mongoliimonas terrestris]